MIPALRRVKTKQEDLRQLQDSLDAVLNIIRGKQIIDGRLIEDIELSTTALNINHGLDNEVRGWIVVKKNANADVYEATSASTDLPKKQLKLIATAAVTISLWVF